MAQSKKKSSPPGKKSSAAVKKSNSKQKRHIASVVLFAAAALILFIAIIKGEHLWTYLHMFIMGMFGWNAYLIPFLLGYIAVLLAADSESRTITGRTMIISGILFIAASMVDIFQTHLPDDTYWQHLGRAYTTGSTGVFSGGFTGALLGDALYKGFGATGAKIIIIILAVVFVMLLTGTTVVSVFKAVEKPAKRIKEAAEDAYERRAEREAEKAAARADGLVEVADPSDRSQYDIPMDGDGNADESKRSSRSELRKKGKKMLDTYHGTDKIDIDVSDADGEERKAPSSPFDIMINDGEGADGSTDDDSSAAQDGKEPVLSPELLNALAGDIEVISDEKKRKANDRFSEQPEEPELDSDENADAEDGGESEEYKFPPIDLLKQANDENVTDIRNELTTNAEKLVDTLHSFGVDARVINISRGPSVTRYELQPAAGVRISRIAGLTDDIALSLASSGVRIEAPIPNKPAVGIEVPNKAKSSVSIRSLIDCDAFANAKSRITGVLGKDITGENCYMDIAKMPHVLIAGTTGSGKSVCLNSLIVSILYRATPDEVKFVMIDPKAVEMKVYNGIPHLLVPVVTDPRKASGTLGWAVTEMLRRYQLLSEYDVRNIDGYNELADKDDSMEKLPQIVIFIDELADLMMAAPSEVEDSICRLAQMARAAGMHLVIATQSPRADVITGLIKSNIPSRIALKVASNIESRIILDMQGAERLIGYGDMLYAPVGSSKPTRIQGCWISDEEIKAVTDFIKGKGGHANYSDSIMQEIERQAALANQKKKASASADSDGGDGDADEMLPKAIECVIEAGQASTSLLQRKLKLGYARAARIIDQLEERKIIGPYEGSKPRSVLISHQQWLEMQAGKSDNES